MALSLNAMGVDVDGNGVTMSLPAVDRLYDADHAAPLLPYRSVRIDSPALGCGWRLRLINPHSPTGPALETYLPADAEQAMAWAMALLEGRAICRTGG